MHLKEIHRCEAPYHVEGCKGIGNTKDHFTPKRIALKLGWTLKQIHAVENTQWLSEPCHKTKDRETPAMGKILDRILAGETVLFFDLNTEHKKNERAA